MCFRAPSKDRSVPAPKFACGTPSHTARCASAFPGRRASRCSIWFISPSASSMRRRIFRRDAVGIVDVEHGVARTTQRNAGILARQKTGAPKARGNSLHVGFRIRVSGVAAPRTWAGPGSCCRARKPIHEPMQGRAGDHEAGLQEGDGRLVIDGFGVHACG